MSLFLGRTKGWVGNCLDPIYCIRNPGVSLSVGGKMDADEAAHPFRGDTTVFT